MKCNDIRVVLVVVLVPMQASPSTRRWFVHVSMCFCMASHAHQRCLELRYPTLRQFLRRGWWSNRV
ncbi:hypothetical protein K435DRAFT_48368 [Dendrothele bispora CBS 962.96]|uniref:Uncharacterized protein n=1 Tax=Dendrothele bispora (strain CBS 962.96) TaxID=1314807 RepID=A0A4S8M7T5_DENBC|nr:hypothetical protein K435DRAFT_48368 [Dendrothele bispora CBS 962.96]